MTDRAFLTLTAILGLATAGPAQVPRTPPTSVQTPPTPPAPPEPRRPVHRLDAFGGGGESLKTIVRDGEGFAVTLPAGTMTGWGQFFQREAGFGLGGDFEFSCGYEVQGLAGPGGQPAGEVKAGLALNGPEVIELSVAGRPGQSGEFAVYRVTPTATRGLHYGVRHMPRVAATGRLVLRRRGAELSLLAADGPGAAPTELLRYPIDPQAAPRPRVFAYRQSAATGLVEVKLTDLTYTAGRLVVGPAADTAPAPPAAYPVRVAYAGNPAGLLADFSKTWGKPGWFSTDSAGVRAAPPVVATHRKDDQAFWVRECRYTVAGDFEVQMGYDIRKLGPPGPGGYSGPSFGLAVETEGPLGSVNLKREVNGQNRPQFVVFRHTPTKTGPAYDVMPFPSAGTPTGRLVFRRTGVSYTLFAADGDAEPQELVRFPFLAGPVNRLRLMFDQGGTATAPLDVAVTELTVRADKLADDRGSTLAAAGVAPTGGEVTLDAAPRPSSRKWLYLGLAAAVVAGSGLAAGVMGLARRRRTRDG